MARRRGFSLFEGCEVIGLPLSGLIILMSIAGWHLAKAGIDLFAIAHTAGLGAAQPSNVADLAIGAGLAALPFTLAAIKRRRRRKNAPSVPPDCPFDDSLSRR